MIPNASAIYQIIALANISSPTRKMLSIDRIDTTV